MAELPASLRAAGIDCLMIDQFYFGKPTVADVLQMQRAHVVARYDAALAELRKGPSAYLAQGNGVQIKRDEMLGWAAFAEAKSVGAVDDLRKAADLQDKVGQGEVDIPAREMLADVLLEAGHPKEALVEYEVALRLSPNRLNGLYNARQAAEASGDKASAELYYAALVKSTGPVSERPEVVRVRRFLAGLESATW